MNKIKAFTLTEVLLTLAIIGVITAVTIPPLMSQNHAKKYQTLTKKAIYTLQAAVDAKFEHSTKKASDFNGKFFTWLTNEGSDPDKNPEDAIRLTRMSSNGRNAQTADGIIFRMINIDTDERYKHHIIGDFIIDLNGAEPPTQTAFDGTLPANYQQNEDIIFLELDRHGTIKPCKSCANDHANTYFDVSNRGI